MDYELDRIVQRATANGVVVDMALYAGKGVDDLGLRRDHVEAQIDGTAIGFLRSCYFPSEVFSSLYPDAVRYGVSEMTGSHAVVRDIYATYSDERQWGEDELRAVIGRSHEWMMAPPDMRVVGEMDLDELRSVWKKSRRHLTKRYAADYARAKTGCDKPHVAYVDVYAPTEPGSYQNGEAHRRTQIGRDGQGQAVYGADWRRQGVATLLYETSGLWLAERGMDLHGSSNQAPEATATWNALARRHATYPVSSPEGALPRLALDGAALTKQLGPLPAARPQLGKLATAGRQGVGSSETPSPTGRGR